MCTRSQRALGGPRAPFGASRAANLASTVANMATRTASLAAQTAPFAVRRPPRARSSAIQERPGTTRSGQKRPKSSKTNFSSILTCFWSVFSLIFPRPEVGFQSVLASLFRVFSCGRHTFFFGFSLVGGHAFRCFSTSHASRPFRIPPAVARPAVTPFHLVLSKIPIRGSGDHGIAQPQQRLKPQSPGLFPRFVLLVRPRE